MNRLALARYIRMPSASSLDRAERCVASLFLPIIREPSDRYAERGSGVHAFVLRAREIGRKEALAEIPKKAPHRRLCERLPVDLLPEGGQLEVAFAYDPETDTARILGYNIGRQYEEHGATFRDICGTADLQGSVGDTLVIIDWKSGYMPLPDALESWQLRFLALAGCRALGFSKARVAYWILREDGNVIEDAAELDAFDLDTTADRLRSLVSRVFAAAAAEEEAPEVSVGEWCRYCECKAACPAMGGAVRTLIAMPSATELVTPAHVAKAFLLIEKIKPLLAAYEERIKMFAREAPIDLGDGRVLSEQDKSKRVFDTDKAFAALQAEFGDEIAAIAAERRFTLDTLSRSMVVAAERLGQPVDTLEARALKVIGDAGGVTVVPGSEVRARKALKAS